MTSELLRKRLKTIQIKGKKIILSDIAKKLGIPRQQLNTKLNAKRIDDAFLTDLADAIGVNKYDLLREEKEGTIQEPNALNMTHTELLIKTQQDLVEVHKELELALKQTISLQAKVIESKDEALQVLKQWNDAKGKLNRK